MKILLIAPQSIDTVLGVIGIYCKNALIKLGHDVDVFDFRESRLLKSSIGSVLRDSIKKICRAPREQFPIIKSLETQKMNRALYQSVRQLHPNVMLVLMGDNIFPETLDEIKRQGVIRANWFTDTVIDPRSGRMPLAQKIAPHYEYFFIYDSEDVLKHIKIGAKCVKSIPMACDPAVHKSIDLTQQEKTQYGSDICFIGSIDYGRQELLTSLSDFDLGIWGNWDCQEPLLKAHYRKKHVYLEEAAKIYNASKIALDSHIFFSAGKEAFDINPRVYEATGCGIFTLTNESPYINELYEVDKEIVCYRDKNDLRKKIAYYLKHPQERQIIARNGQKRAHRDHTYEQRLKKIISTIEGTER